MKSLLVVESSRSVRAHILLAFICCALSTGLVLVNPAATAQTPAPGKQKAPPVVPVVNKDGKHGSIEKITVHGKSLEGNLEGDTPDREVLIYLPPSYYTSKNRRYPVVYFLHGYGVGAESYWNSMTVPATSDKLMAGADAPIHEMIFVHPDADTIYDGSMYSNSPTTGNWETFLTKDLIDYVDGHYRTIAKPESRGLAGHSMGGYGTLRIAMKHPGIFSSILPMSSCCLMNNPGAAPAGGQGKGKGAPPAQAKAPVPPPPATKGGDAAKGKGKGGGGGFANVQSAEAAAWSPNPMNPPKFFDMPTVDGKVNPAIAAKWIANSPLAMIDQFVQELKGYKAIKLEVGLQDSLANSNREMDESMKRLGITHSFETYEGDHTNRLKERFEGSVLPFFSENLVFPASKASKKK